MTLDLLSECGTPLDNQRFTWSELAGLPISKLDTDAYTRVRILLMNSIESEAVRFSHACARMQPGFHREMSQIRRVELQQQTLIHWLLPADLSPLEMTIAYEQVAIDITAGVAMRESDPILTQLFKYGILDDFDHLYRFSALLDRLHGKDANNILQSYTDILPGRPTAIAPRPLQDELTRHYDRLKAKPLTKLHAYTIMAAEDHARDYYMTIGPMFSDPLARLIFAEIAAIKEQHATQYESFIDSTESWAEKWVLHEANEVYNYYSCAQQESDPRIRAVWERMVDYELGHLQVARRAFEKIDDRQIEEILPQFLPDILPHGSQRAFVRSLLTVEVRSHAGESEVTGSTHQAGEALSAPYAGQSNQGSSPSSAVAQNYQWRPGTELTAGNPDFRS